MHRLGSVSECNSKLNLHLCRQALLTLSSDTFFSTERKRVFFIIIIIIVSSIQPEFAIVYPSLYYCLSPSALSLSVSLSQYFPLPHKHRASTSLFLCLQNTERTAFRRCLCFHTRVDFMVAPDRHAITVG